MKRNKLPAIADVLGIEISGNVEDGFILNGFKAVASKLSGHSPVGYGQTYEEAKYDLLANLMWNFAMSEGNHFKDVFKLMHESVFGSGSPLAGRRDVHYEYDSHGRVRGIIPGQWEPAMGPEEHKRLYQQEPGPVDIICSECGLHDSKCQCGRFDRGC